MAFARVQHFDGPPLPANRLRALELLAQPSVELGELVDIAELDPAMTVALLRMANSASSSPSRRLTTARTAVVRLGSLPTRRVIAGTVLSTSFPQPTPDIIDSGEYWRHALAVALIADAAAVARGSRSEAFTVGLLHDMGCLAMAASEPARYQRVARLVRAGVTERDAEQAIFGHDHAYYGCLVAEQWGLGDSIARRLATTIPAPRASLRAPSFVRDAWPHALAWGTGAAASCARCRNWTARTAPCWRPWTVLEGSRRRSKRFARRSGWGQWRAAAVVRDNRAAMTLGVCRAAHPAVRSS